MMRFSSPTADLLAAWRAVENSGSQLGRPVSLSPAWAGHGSVFRHREKELPTLADWLRCLPVPAGVLEATNGNGHIAQSPVCGSYGATVEALAQLGPSWSGGRTNVA
jgi:hypothetical protein